MAKTTNQTGAGKNRKRKKYRRPGILAWIVSALCLAACAFFVFELVVLDVLPSIYLAVISLAAVLIPLIVILIWLFKTRRWPAKSICFLLVCALGCMYGVGGIYLQDTQDMFNQVTNLTDKQANVVSVYVMNEKGISEPGQMQNMTIGTLSALDSEGTSGALAQLRSKGAYVTAVEYEDPYSLVDDLYAGAVDSIALPEQYHDQIYLIANDDNKYNALTTFTTTVDQYVYYVDRPEESINPADPVGSVVTDPFVVLISGNDSYGAIGSNGRSDVNMLAVINPKTYQVLLLSLPRDTYTIMSCSKNASACAPVAGQADKLTHAGLYGIGTLESTLEDLLGIEINYTVQVNFSSVLGIVDAIGGVDVEVEPGLEVETFYANGAPGVTAGINHLDGERALAFARERYAYVDGDLQRTRNQQILMKAMIKAMMSPDMVVNYPKVMKALSTAFATNMTARDIKSLISLELLRFPNWNIQTYAISGEPALGYSAAAKQDLSVTLDYNNQLAYAKELVNEVLSGKTLALDGSQGLPDASQGLYDPDGDSEYGQTDESWDSSLWQTYDNNEETWYDNSWNTDNSWSTDSSWNSEGSWNTQDSQENQWQTEQSEQTWYEDPYGWGESYQEDWQ